MVQRETVLVTGAAGSVGIHLVKELLQAGFRVRATDLPGRRFPFGGSRVSIVTGDLQDPQFVARLPVGVRYVIHAGAATDIALPWETIRRVNLAATVDLWQAADKAKVETFVYFSSASIYEARKGALTEADPPDLSGKYERSKYLAEKALVRSRLAGNGPRLVILRPALTIGPHGTALLNTVCAVPPLLKHLVGFAPRFIGGPLINVVHSLDAARAAIHLLEKGEDGQAYNVANEEPISFGDFFNIASREYGLLVLPIPPVLFPPRQLVRLVLPVGKLPEPFWLFNKSVERAWYGLKEQYHLQGDLRPRFDREALYYCLNDHVIDSTRLRQTGFDYRFPDFASAIRDVLDWFKRERWIPV